MGAIQDKIKRLREVAGLTQQELADRLNVHLKTYQKIENGATRLDLERMQQVATILDTSVEDIIKASEECCRTSIGGNKIIRDSDTATEVKELILLYERIISEKCIQISMLHKDIAYYKETLELVLHQIAKKLEDEKGVKG